MVGMKKSPGKKSSSQKAGTSRGSQQGRGSALSRASQRVQQGRASVPATIRHRSQQGRASALSRPSRGSQQGRASAPGSTGQTAQQTFLRVDSWGQWRRVRQFLRSGTLRDAITGQPLLPRGTFRAAPTGQPLLQRGFFGAPSIGQQPQRSSSVRPASTGQQSWASAREASSGWPSSSWPGRFSPASSVSRRERDCLLQREPPHHVLDTWQGDNSRGGHSFGPSASFQDSSARQRFRSRSPLQGTDFHPLSPHRVSTPRDQAPPRDQEALVPANSSSLRAPPPNAARATSPRKRERGRSLQRGYDRRRPSAGFRDSAGKRRRNLSAEPKKTDKSPKGQRR
ncbi:zinc finger CCCH domain-containing protein 18-like [Heliangelus exortis]|uniref:zinc finger CCCH domain-containing protein 18-like n=1 Tax=Heliangelus exortis TaxID=472823 RepID=UPI003A942805